ncbi:MAG: hypothetical protein H6707_07370 [Deltaproteobacteria bacterium]|nr:hypothetical protein [Deltaproteobacteria bacterium]
MSTTTVYGKQSQRVLPPSDSELETFADAWKSLIRGRVREAADGFAAVGYRLVELIDEGRSRYLIQSSVTRTRSWGLYAYDAFARRPLLIEAPHPRHDKYTGRQSARLFASLGGRAFMMATSYRCSGPRASGCFGRASRCRSPRDGRNTDVAHNVRSFFHVAHRTLLQSDPALVAVQLHGYSRRPGRRLHIIVSDGTRLPAADGALSNRLARVLRTMVERRAVIRSCNERDNRSFLCGTFNVQGRYANGSPEPCRKRGASPSGRFLHIEQSLSARRQGGDLSPSLLTRALRELFPSAR